MARHRHRPGGDEGVDLVAQRLALGVGRILAAADDVLAAHQRGEACEDLVGGAGDRQPAPVLRRVVAVRHGVDGAGAHALPHRAILVIDRGELVEDAEDRLVEADIDDLPRAGEVAGAQRVHGTERAVDPGEVVGDRRRAGRHRRAVGIAGEEGEAAEGVGDAAEAGAVAVGAGLPVAGDADHDQPGIAFAQRLPADAPALERADLEILDQDIGLADQALQDVGALVGAQVERHRLLVALLAEEQQGFLALALGAEAAQRVAGPRQLDLDRLGAELGELGGAERPGDVARHVEHADAVERADRWGGHAGSFSGPYPSTRVSRGSG